MDKWNKNEKTAEKQKNRREKSLWYESEWKLSHWYVCFVIAFCYHSFCCYSLSLSLTPINVFSLVLLYFVSIRVFVWKSVYLCVKLLVGRTFTKVIGESYMLQKIRLFTVVFFAIVIVITINNNHIVWAINNLRTFSVRIGFSHIYRFSEQCALCALLLRMSALYMRAQPGSRLSFLIFESFV